MYVDFESIDSNNEQGRKSAYVEIQGVGKGGVREKWIRVRQIQIKYKGETNTNMHKYRNIEIQHFVLLQKIIQIIHIKCTQKIISGVSRMWG